MKRKILFATPILITLLAIIGFLLKKPNIKKEEISQTVLKSYFVPVSITKFSSIQAPCLDVQIGNNTFSMELDLGLRGDLSISSAYIDQIEPKEFIETQLRYGFREKEYQINFYQIPDISIGDMFFIRPVLQKSSDEFRKNSVIVKEGHSLSPGEHGRVGWELFYNVNLLLDTKNSQIAFFDSVDTLEKVGYSVADFVRAPLFIDRGLVEIEVQTSEKSFRCLLDTGCTYNFVNSEIEEGKTIEEIAFDPSYITEYPTLQIGNVDFGPIEFHRIPIKMPIQIDMVLGMEFFENHLMFIDFVNRHVYFAKEQVKTELCNKY